MTDITPDVIAPTGPPKAKFDDRIDTETRISNLEVVSIHSRSLKLLASVPKLFVSKLALSALAIIPGLYCQWVPKIIIDQVLLQKPIEQTEVPFPPHMAPLVVKKILEQLDTKSTTPVGHLVKSRAPPRQGLLFTSE